MPPQISLNVDGFRSPALASGPADGELVLFLHGFPEFADAWLPLMRAAASSGFRAVAVDQRGYSPEVCPPEAEAYSSDHLLSDVLGFADELGAERFHLVAHDWGGLIAWQIAAEHPERTRSLTVLSTPHTDAFLNAIETDEDQKQRSKYIAFFRMPGRAAESFFEADDYTALRRVYQGKVAEAQLVENVRRFAAPGVLTGALNWYRALNLETRIGDVSVPTLFLWGSEDLAVGEAAATATAAYVTGPYRFERLEGKSHWLVEEVPELILTLILDQLQR